MAGRDKDMAAAIIDRAGRMADIVVVSFPLPTGVVDLKGLSIV
jgi:hypothetical protein